MGLHEINTDLLKAEQALFEMQQRFPDIAKTAANARYVYDQAWANAIDGIAHRTLAEGQKSPTVPVQDAMATKMVAEEMKDVREAEADLNAATMHIKTLQAILSSIQTRAKMYLAETTLK